MCVRVRVRVCVCAGVCVQVCVCVCVLGRGVVNGERTGYQYQYRLIQITENIQINGAFRKLSRVLLSFGGQLNGG